MNTTMKTQGADKVSTRGISPSMIPSLAGAISGMTSRFFVAPLDVLKIRFQLQRQVVLYRGILSSISIIATQEGIKSLWKGNLSGELLWIFYSSQSFFVYEKTSSILKKQTLLSHSPGKRDLICGGTAGLAATLGSYPLDLVRTRLIAQHETQRVYRHILEAFSRIYSERGMMGFYSGVFPTVVATIPYTAIQFATYKKLNRLISDPNNKEIHALQPLLTGLVSSIVAKVVCLPLDVTKKRLQVSNFSYGKEIHSYSGFVCCVRQTLSEEGISAFYKGGTVSVLKTGIGGGLSFMFYELAKARLTNYALPPSQE